MSTQNSVVAVYRTHTEADQAVRELQRGGVDMHKLSIVGKGYHTDEHVVDYYCMDRWSLGRCGSGGRRKRAGSRPLQLGNSQGQYREVRGGAQDRPVRVDRPRYGRRSGEGEGHHRNHASRPIVVAVRRSGSCGSRLAFLRYREPSRRSPHNTN
jgi:hypothetical protein